jgi:zinc resistance-associated protein
MRVSKHILVAATAAAVSVATLFGASFAQESGQPDRQRMSAEDRAAFLDARIAALKAGLELTPDQEKNWAPLEAAIREQAKERAERRVAWREQRESQEERRDPIERLQMRPQWLTQRAAELEKLIAAAKPLYDALDEGQKRRFAELMRPPGGDRQRWRHEG